MKGQSHAGLLILHSQSCRYRKYKAASNRSGGIGTNQVMQLQVSNSRQDSRQSELKVVLKSGRVWNWVGELKAAMGEEKMHTNESICQSHQIQPAAVWGLNRNCSPTYSCVFTRSNLPLCETNGGWGRWRLYGFCESHMYSSSGTLRPAARKGNHWVGLNKKNIRQSRRHSK